MVTIDTLLYYPNFVEFLGICVDTSDTQLGVVIGQDGNWIALYSRKSTGHQKKY